MSIQEKDQNIPNKNIHSKKISPVNKEEHSRGNIFINPVLIIAKGEPLKIVLDAKHLNSLFDEPKCKWSVEPIQLFMQKEMENTLQQLT